MVLVDSKDGAGADKDISGTLVSYIRRCGVNAEKDYMDEGDFAFEGNGPEGRILIGVERKTLRDLIHCIHDARYNDQRVRMKETYRVSFLAVEGMWRPHEDGCTMEGFNGGASWGYFRVRTSYSARIVDYSEIYRYLLSVSLTGVIVTLSRDLFHTAYNVCEIWRYFNKPWSDHDSMLQTRTLNIPSLEHRPSLTRLWAADIEGIGVKRSEEAERLFRTPIQLATSEEQDWLQLSGVGEATARNVLKQIHGEYVRPYKKRLL